VVTEPFWSIRDTQRGPAIGPGFADPRGWAILGPRFSPIRAVGRYRMRLQAGWTARRGSRSVGLMRRKVVPDRLRNEPLSIRAAELEGVSRSQLRGASWRRLGRGRYVWATASDQPMLELLATLQRLPRGAVFSHLTAAWLYGLDVGQASPADVIVPGEAAFSRRAGINVHRDRLASSDVARRHRLPVTSPIRTCLDLARELPLREGVVAVDMALHRKLVRLEQLQQRLHLEAGKRGVRQARRILELAEPRSESAMESRLRMVLVEGGLPRPEAQVTLRDGRRFLGRADLYYPRARLCIEYDGSTHRDSLEADDLRKNRLVSAGYRLLRYTAPQVYGHADEIVAEVRALLKGG
jgi:very-short-patch-repair endonuclease